MVAQYALEISPCYQVDDRRYGPWIPLDIDVFAFDNSDSDKEGRSLTYKKVDSFSPIFAYPGPRRVCAVRPGCAAISHPFDSRPRMPPGMSYTWALLQQNRCQQRKNTACMLARRKPLQVMVNLIKKTNAISTTASDHGFRRPTPNEIVP